MALLEVGGGTGIIAQGQTVYASQESLYVSTNVYIPNDAWERFPNDMVAPSRKPTSRPFTSSISLARVLPSIGRAVRWAISSTSSPVDEFEGFLRVATTMGSPWGGDDSESQVVVLGERNGVLTQVGAVGDMGEGERIYSVRFIGATGYVVTFRQWIRCTCSTCAIRRIRPSRANWKIPRLLGLYLHPLGDGLLLGVGQDADSDGRTLGAKATLFDVSDPANPRVGFVDQGRRLQRR